MGTQENSLAWFYCHQQLPPQSQRECQMVGCRNASCHPWWLSPCSARLGFLNHLPGSWDASWAQRTLSRSWSSAELSLDSVSADAGIAHLHLVLSSPREDRQMRHFPVGKGQPWTLYPDSYFWLRISMLSCGKCCQMLAWEGLAETASRLLKKWLDLLSKWIAQSILICNSIKKDETHCPRAFFCHVVWISGLQQ